MKTADWSPQIGCFARLPALISLYMRRFATLINENARNRAENRHLADTFEPVWSGSGKKVVEVFRREYVNQVAKVPDGQYSLSERGDI